MCDVLPLQPAGFFLRTARSFRTSHAVPPFSNPILAGLGNCTDIDVALGLELKYDTPLPSPTASHLATQSQLVDEPLDFLTIIRCGLEDAVDDREGDGSDSDVDSDDDDDDTGASGYYQGSKENTYYSPGQKSAFSSAFQDDALYLSDTSTASSSLVTAWALQESDDEEAAAAAAASEASDDDDDDDDLDALMFQLEM
ncbi:unnamed protein product [Hyaloperonospora brassicae]|uniref:RxLR effector candidate protein n=1 Tax=Hyaloperonospora brassicae TaxID=162125 RepID=A0AAV0UPC7_HYABA|nr:unnamed protein product [Hyaloperonospora brassicae]